MKTVLVSFILYFAFFCCSAQAGPKDKSFTCSNGKIHFLASTPVEDIEAASNSAACVMNAVTKKISAKVSMTTFEFRRKKMQDDFNEDYIESAKFPYAVLEATIVNKVDFTKTGVYDVTLKGTFEIHGVKQNKEIHGKLTVKNGQPASATAQFDIKLVDHNIKVPTIVVVKIAEVVKVDINFVFVNNNPVTAK